MDLVIVAVAATALIWLLVRMSMWLIGQWRDAAVDSEASPTTSDWDRQANRELVHSHYRVDQRVYQRGGPFNSRPMLLLQLFFIALVMVVLGLLVAELVRQVLG